MIPKYDRPEAPSRRRGAGGGAAGRGRADRRTKPLRWREFFVDERLRTVIELALENNRDLRVAALNVEKARARYRIQRSELYPRSASWRPARSTAFPRR